MSSRPTGCSSTASTRPVMVPAATAGRLQLDGRGRPRAARPEGRTWSASASAFGRLPAAPAAISSRPRNNSSVPPRRTAVEVTTGTPSSPKAFLN